MHMLLKAARLALKPDVSTWEGSRGPSLPLLRRHIDGGFPRFHEQRSKNRYEIFGPKNHECARAPRHILFKRRHAKKK